MYSYTNVIIVTKNNRFSIYNTIIKGKGGSMNFNYDELDSLYKYEEELGAIYTKRRTVFRIWSPLAENIKLKLYGKEGYDYSKGSIDIIEMKKVGSGVFERIVEGDLHGEYYNYLVNINGEINEVVDIYAKAVGVNGKRGMVINLDNTNPENWENHIIPSFDPLDSIIYELNVRDFTIDKNSLIDEKIRGKFKGLIQEINRIDNITIGFNHLKELGINTIQLMPSFDYKTVDEEKFSELEYNWGYDPLNYNALEGSYSTNPYLAQIRIKEFKEMILKAHENNIKVIMDVVYNHTFDTETSNFNRTSPTYYYRQNKGGGFSNGSGCGNEIASERYMVRKFIIDSVIYWAKEYKIDGFRFDLMALHDMDTMRSIREELSKINKNILIYGEGWTADNSPLSDDKLTLKKNIKKFDKLQIGAFSDDIRDAIKGDVFEKEKGGFINGESNLEESLKFGIIASIKHKDIDYNKVIYSEEYWAKEPYQVITYTSAHDNYTLWDKICLVETSSSEQEKIDMNKMAAAIVLTSQGIPFIHSGDEILRTKRDRNNNLIENSYKSPDCINKFDWKRKEKYIDVFNYYKKLIDLRKKHEVFKMKSAVDIQENISFLSIRENFSENNIVGYIADGEKVGDKLGKIAVIFNSNKNEVEVELNHNKFKVIAEKDDINEEGLYDIEGKKIKVKPISFMILKYL